MRLLTFELDGATQLGAYSDNGIVNLTAIGTEPAFASMQALIEGGEEALDAARDAVEHAEEIIDPLSVRILAPLPRPLQMRDCLGFELHVKNSYASALRLLEGQAEIPREALESLKQRGNPSLDTFRKQVIYYKSNRFAVSGPGTEVFRPAYSKLMDFELELACVIGKAGCDIPKDRAREHIFGFTIFNDFTARDAQAAEQMGMLGPCKGKDFDLSNVLGPVIVTADEIGDPYNLRMQARVNGELLCDSNSSTIGWTFEDMIAHISQDETLYPGEVIGSGTVGWGCGLEHMRFLQDGDVVELEIEKIGTLTNRLVAPRLAA